MPRIRARKVTPVKFATLIREFMATDIWKGYQPETQRGWGKQFRDAEDPDALGDYLTTELTPADVQEYLDDIADRPSKQAVTLRALRRLDSWAGLRGKLPRQVTFGCEALGDKGGHVPWELRDVALALRHVPPHLARAIMLGYYTGQRCSDLVKMKYSDVEYDMAMDICEIHVIQKKTGRDLWVPFPEELKDAYQTWVRRVPDNLILSSRNKPYKANALSKAWRRHRDAIPALAPLKDKGLVMHGLRGGCCVRYSRLSLSDHQIGDMIGMSVPMVSRYTRLSNQRANSRAALAQLKKNGG